MKRMTTVVRMCRQPGTFVYGDVMFTGAPENGGKYPSRTTRCCWT